ncbi:MAG: tetratricopeptide repeat protein [Candidatus Sulfotelmatobacter sp.]
MSSERAAILQERAWNLQTEGKLDEAAAACFEALRLLDSAGESDSPDAANLLNDLAEVESERQNASAAFSWARRAQDIENRLGDQFCGVLATRIRARTLQLIGEARRLRGEYQYAETSLKAALEIVVADFGGSSIEAANASNDLAVLYKYWGRFDDGLRLYERALPSVIACHGEESLEVATLYHNLGGILHSKGDFLAAEQPGRKAWEISRRLLGEDDPRAQMDAVAYAAILDGLQRYEESEAIYRAALEIFDKQFGSEHFEAAATMHNLAAVLCARGERHEAEHLYRKCLAIKEKVLGHDHPDVALTCNNLGNLLNSEGRCSEALPLVLRAVAILQNRLPQDHPHLDRARANLSVATSSSHPQSDTSRNPSSSCALFLQKTNS